MKGKWIDIKEYEIFIAEMFNIAREAVVVFWVAIEVVAGCCWLQLVAARVDKEQINEDHAYIWEAHQVLFLTNKGKEQMLTSHILGEVIY